MNVSRAWRAALTLGVLVWLSVVAGGRTSVVQSAAAQKALRRDGGARLIVLEATWERHRNDVAARRRSLPHIERALASFFAADLSPMCFELDTATSLLESPKPMTAEQGAAAALAVDIVPRLQPVDVTTVPAAIRSTYRVPDHRPLAVRGRAIGPTQTPCGAWSDAKPLNNGAAKLTVDFAADVIGDCNVEFEVTASGQPVRRWLEPIARVANLSQRLDAIRAVVARFPVLAGTNEPTTISMERASLGQLLRTLESIAAAQGYEVDLHAAALLDQAEAAAKSIDAGRAYWSQRAGSFLLCTVDGVFFRISVPAKAVDRGPVPLLLALHGAGGSENMFFEAYGQGLVAKLAEERGWIVVSPRSVFGFSSTPVFSTIDGVASLYNIDRRRIFAVGHSMGGMQAVGAARQRPGLFAAIAAIASGAVGEVSALNRLPVLVTTADHDFARSTSRQLAAKLQQAGNPNVTFREYADAEHLLVVRESLEDAMIFFDEVSNREPKTDKP